MLTLVWGEHAGVGAVMVIPLQVGGDGLRRLVFEIGTEEMPPAEAQAARDQLTGRTL